MPVLLYHNAMEFIENNIFCTLLFFMLNRRRKKKFSSFLLSLFWNGCIVLVSRMKDGARTECPAEEPANGWKGMIQNILSAINQFCQELQTGFNEAVPRSLADFVAGTSAFLWGAPLLILLVGTHLYLTFRLRFIQRYIPKAIRLSITKDEHAVGDISPFGALSVALAATIGTGNIIGVATAIALGGPGAVFWCWIVGIFGIATKYAEGVLAVRYRVTSADGDVRGGPMFAIRYGMNCKWLAVFFALMTMLASFGVGNLAQSNAVAVTMRESLHVPPLITGILMTGLVAAVVLGGLKTIARVCEKIVPLMAACYLFGCFAVLCLNAEYILPSLRLILESAFSSKAAGGGFVGVSVLTAMRYGVARGLFSNESGLGSAPIVAAAAKTRNPVRQALISSTGTFWDTVVICAITGVVLVSNCLALNIDVQDGATLTHKAFERIPVVGPLILTFGIVSFAYTTILGWSYYGEKAFEYVFGGRGITLYRLLFVFLILTGSVISLKIVWDFSDAANALMALPNLICLIALTPVIVNETRRYLWNGMLDEFDSRDTLPVENILPSSPRKEGE